MEKRAMEGFDQIAQELLNQKRRMEALEAENRQLRRQIADLRKGAGIYVEIGGVRVALKDVAALQPVSSYR